MVKEKSAGMIVFRLDPTEGLQYLVLYIRKNYWNFPKGRVEVGETEVQAGLRELKEEAGIEKVKVIDGWRQETDFFFKEERDGKEVLIKKKMVLFLAAADNDAMVKIEKGRVNGYGWFNYKIAAKYLRFGKLKVILEEANSLVEKKIAEARELKKQKENAGQSEPNQA